MQNFGFSMIWYWSAYFLVTIVGVMHTVFNIYVLRMKPMDEKSMGEGYEKTKPWHPLYNLIIFSLFALLYLQTLTSPTMRDALTTGAIWLAITIVVDLIGWVLIKHPWSLTFHGFYVDYQPWITLIYLAIFIAPLLAFLFFI